MYISTYFIPFEGSILDIWPTYLSVCDTRTAACYITEMLTKTTRSFPLKILPISVLFIFHCVEDPGKETAVYTEQCFKCCLPFHVHVTKRSMHVFKFSPEYPSIAAYFHPIYSQFYQCKQLVFLNKYVYLVKIPLRLSRHNSDACMDTVQLTCN